MRVLAVFALAVLLVSVASLPSHAEKRVALVIGNAAYRSAPALANPKNDANDVAGTLKRNGFEVIVGLDLDQLGMQDTVIRFARAVRDADVAMFYYSGHALQFGGVNYLLPIDAKLTDDSDLRRLTRVDEIAADLQNARSVRILVLDSCRDNPLAEDLKRSIGASRGASLERGLARIDAPQGMIVAYATQAGRTAADGTDRNSPYTAAFLKYIDAPDEVGTVFRRISAEVYETSKHAQLPELSVSLIGEFYFRGTAQIIVPGAAPPATPPGPSEAERAWVMVQNTTSINVLEEFVRRFGDDFYAVLARERLDELKKKLAAVSPVRPAAPPPPAQPAVGIFEATPSPATAPARGCVAVTVRATGEANVIAKPPVGSPDVGAIDYWHAMPGYAWYHDRIASPGATSAWSCPSIAVRSTGEALVVDRDANNNLIYYHATPGSSWSRDQIDGPGTTTIPGSPPTRSAAIAVRANDEVDIVTAGPKGEVMYYFQFAGAAKFNSSTIADSKTSPGLTNNSIAVRSNGEADVVTLSPNNDLLYFFATPGSPWHGPTTIVPSGTLLQGPAIGVRSNGEAYIVAENLNAGLTGYRATPGSSWSADPISGPQTVNSPPSLAVRSTGEIDVVANGFGGSLFYYWQTRSSSPWYSVAIANSNVVSAPAIAVRSNGEADVVAIQSPYNVTYWHAMPGQPWSSPAILPR
jgi:hypothetical protein